MTTLEKVGSRLYFVGLPFAAKDRAKKLGGHWDADRKQWWIGAAKKADAAELVAELNGAPVPTQREATTASDRAAAGVGLTAGTPADIVADRLQDDGRDKEAAALRKPAEDLSACRVHAKVEYRGRTYYVIARTMTPATIQQGPQPLRVRLATLQEDGPVFWADAPACRLLKEYPGREVWDGRRYSSRTVTRYTTLGSLRAFVAGQREAEKQGLPQCAACGKRGELVHDLEDGLEKCHACCDMPE